MSKDQKLITITLVICFFVFLMILFDMAAYHDIAKDYVSTSVLKSLDLSLAGDLPDWTSTKGEWDLVNVSWLSRILFFVLNIIVLSRCLTSLKNVRRRGAGDDRNDPPNTSSPD
jgi:hypothetical protein